MATNKRKIKSLHPQLTRVVLNSFNIEHSFNDGKKTPITISLEKEIGIETFPPSDITKQVRLSVTVNLTVKCVQIEEENNSLTATGSYVGRFLFPKNVSVKDADIYLENEDNLYLLSSQVLPVAMTHLKAQLQFVGVSTNTLPIGQ